MIHGLSFNFARASLSFYGFPAPFFLYSLPPLLRFFFQMPYYIFFICSSVTLYKCYDMISPYIQHLLYFLGRQQIVQPSQLQVFIVIASLFLDVDEKHMCIDKSVEVKPNSVYRFLFEKSDDILSRKWA